MARIIGVDLGIGGVCSLQVKGEGLIILVINGIRRYVFCSDSLHFAVDGGQIVVIGANPPKIISLCTEGETSVSAGTCIDEYRLAVVEYPDGSKVGVGMGVRVVCAKHRKIKALVGVGIFSHNAKLQAFVVKACGGRKSVIGVYGLTAEAIEELVAGISA